MGAPSERLYAGMRSRVPGVGGVFYFDIHF